MLRVFGHGYTLVSDMACFSAPTAKIVNTQGGGQVSVPRCYNPRPVTKHNPIPSSSSSSISLIIPPLILGRRGRVSASSSGRVVVRGAGGESMAAATEKLGIKIVNNPPESKLSDLGVRSWPKWGCPPSKFPWTYSDKETCYLLKGKVKVYPEGSDEAVEFGAGDLVEFPKGMSCTWDVSEAVDKHYKFE